jgi:hypothetical protein
MTAFSGARGFPIDGGVGASSSRVGEDLVRATRRGRANFIAIRRDRRERLYE